MTVRISAPGFVAMLLAAYALVLNVLFLAAAGAPQAYIFNHAGQLCIAAPQDAGLHSGGAGGTTSPSACFDHCMSALGSALPQLAAGNAGLPADVPDSVAVVRALLITWQSAAEWPRGPPLFS